MNVFSQADDSVGSECINCGAAISPKAKFCEECGTQQTAPPLLSSATENHTSTPAEAGSDDDGTSKHKILFPLFGIAAVLVLITLACLVWFHSHPISAKAQYVLGLKYATGQGTAKDDAEAGRWFPPDAPPARPPNTK